MRLFLNLLLFLFIIFPINNVMAKNLSSDQLQGIKELNAAINEQEKSTMELKKFQMSVIQFGRQRKLDCEFAFGNEKFCACLNEKLPIIVNFEQYVGVITVNKNELLKLATEKGKDTINLVFAARDKCVGLHVNH